MSKGLTNHGNTCYMNSALQCLSHLPQLHPENDKFIMDCTKRLKGNNYLLMREWFKFQKKMWGEGGDTTVIDTQPIIKAFNQLCREGKIHFDSFQQNDTQEFINYFIDFLHNSIKRRVKFEISGKPQNNYDRMKIESIQSWKKFFEDNYSYIINNFFSKLLSITSCPECNYITTNHEPVSTITLSLNPEYKSLYDCLDEYSKEFTLDNENEWRCEKCHRDVRPQKKINFWELSPVLIFLTKQFRISGKINQYIEFPEILNMEKYCLNINKRKFRYKLSGICVHTGSLNGGHYYAMCYNFISKEWQIFNDSNVSSTSIETVLKEKPYCFFYTKII